jgi:hypothetical protein
MVDASLREFMISGFLGNLNCEMSEEDVTRVLGSPPCTDEQTDYVFAFYGCVHVQYTLSGRVAVLNVVVTDSSFPESVAQMRIDPWRITKDVSADKLAEILTLDSIEFFELPSSETLRCFQIVNSPTTMLFRAQHNGQFAIWYLSAVHPNFHAGAENWKNKE